MQYIPMGANTYADADEYGLPPLVLENWFAEEASERVDRPYRLIPAPGLVSFATGLSGATRGMFQSDGLVDGDLVVASGASIHRITSAGAVSTVGTITGTDGVSFAGSNTQLVTAAGGSAYVVTGSLSSAVTVGASTGPITDVAEIGQRHLYLEGGTARFWWSDPLDAATVSNTSFATAEGEPDDVIGLRVFQGTVMLLGTQSVEGWVSTGDLLAPFVRRPGFQVRTGVVGRDAVAELDFGLFLVGTDNKVYRFSGASPQRVSTHTIERAVEKVSDKSAIRLSAHDFGGHAFLGLHLPGVGDYFYDAASGVWHRRRELNAARYVAHDFVQCFGGVYAGDVTAGKVYRLDRSVYTHDSSPVRRVATAIIPVQENRPAVKGLVVEMQGGVGLSNGQGSDPQVMIRTSRNGRVWGNEITRSFGAVGQYNRRAYVNSLGRFEPPAMAVEVAVSDPVPATVTGLAIGAPRA